MSKLIIGCGYLGLRVARRWIAAGHSVAGVVRSEASAADLVAASVRPIVADVTRPETLRDLPAAETLLYCVGYNSAGGASRWSVYVDGLRAVLDAVSPDVRRAILISSTGVYAEGSGGWVDEDSPCGPQHESGRALLAAERVLAEHSLGDRGVVLRLAGIYGPGRLPRRADLLAGKPLEISAGQYINLIHADDAAAAVLAAEALARPPRTYVIADGNPVPRRAFFAEMARQLGLPPPSFCEPPASGARGGRDEGDSPIFATMLRMVPAKIGTVPGEPVHRRGGDKRASNRRMLEELQVRLEYPTYREGLRASVGK